MTALFRRSWSLSADDVDVTDLDLAFEVEKSTHRAPNTALIKIWNLSENTRARVEAASLIVLRAGLGDDPSVIFRGERRLAWTETEALARVTNIRAGDGVAAYGDAHFSRSYVPGVRVSQIVRDLAETMGVGLGNLGDFEYTLRNGAATLADGFIAHGSASRVLQDIVRGAGLRWSIQHGALQFQRGSEPLQTSEIVLDASSGLLGSPTWSDPARRRGIVTAQALIQPGLDPGRRARLDSALITGDFEIRKSKYIGSTIGKEWHANLELRPIS